MKRIDELLRATLGEPLQSWIGPGRSALEPFLVPGELQHRLVERLSVHLELCIAWTKRVDLVADASPELLVRRHLLDSICAFAALAEAVPDQLTAGPVLDVGSGAGFPGLVLAALSPETSYILLEPREQRATFLKEARRRMALPLVEVRSERFEQLRLPPARAPRLVVARALGNYQQYERVAFSLLAHGGAAAVLAGPSFAQLGARILDYELPEGGDHRRIAILQGAG